MLGSDSLLYVPPDQLATTTKIGALQKLSGNTTDFLDGTNTFQPLAPAVQPTIWSARLRSFNAVGNPTFEVDQRNVFSAITLGAGSVSPFAQDRWQNVKVAATMALTSAGSISVTNNILVPGTNFRISQAYQVITLTTAQAVLAAGEVGYLQQNVEGPRFRELTNDVQSISILASTNVTGGLKFALSLRDPGVAHSLVKLCTITAPNQWQLITLPNLPIWASGGNFSSLPGNVGYLLSICYAAGTTYTAPANDVWQNGNFVGAVGMDNLGAKPTGSYLALAFVQHEPGALCTTPIDCPFGQNLDGDFGCLRYYDKSYDYAVKPGTASTNGRVNILSQANNTPYAYVPFKKRMAKVPTVTAYSDNNGAVNTVYDNQAAGNRAVNSAIAPGETGYGGLSLATLNAALAVYTWQHTADTGW
jgi:hypothetical protein